MKEGGFLEKNEQNTDRKRKKKKKLRRQWKPLPTLI